MVCYFCVICTCVGGLLGFGFEDNARLGIYKRASNSKINLNIFNVKKSFRQTNTYT